MPWEFWIVLATLSGPVLAVQAQKWIERARERGQRRAWIFFTLMANRATQLADDYVKALNLIDLSFHPGRFGGKKDRKVIEAWRALFGELCNGLSPKETDLAVRVAWSHRCNDRLVELLAAMSLALGYNFAQEELRRGIYHPQGHVEREQAVLTILGGLRNILEGRDSLRMKITDVPSPPPPPSPPPSTVANEAEDMQSALTKRMLAAYGEDGALKVRFVNEDTPPRRR